MKAKKDQGTSALDLKNTGPFTAEEAASRLALASKQLKGFQLWHPQLHVAHPSFDLKDIEYPIPLKTIPKGITISVLETISGKGPAPNGTAGLIGPFRKAQKKLARVARVSQSVEFFKASKKNCPVGISSMELSSAPGEGIRLQVRLIHDKDCGHDSPQDVLKQIKTEFSFIPESRWTVTTLKGWVDADCRRPNSWLQTEFPAGAWDKVEELLKSFSGRLREAVSAEWCAYFGEFFYHRVYDEMDRWFYLPNPQVLKTTGLSEDVHELIELVNDARFPGQTAQLCFGATFERMSAVRAFFEMALRSTDFFDCALGMFQTDKGVPASYCMELKQGKIRLKVLYPKEKGGGFGWEDAYEKLRRGEKLILNTTPGPWRRQEYRPTSYTSRAVTWAINEENWEYLKKQSKRGESVIKTIAKLKKNPVRIGNLMRVFKSVVDQKPCTLETFEVKSKEGKIQPLQFHVLFREERGKSEILDFVFTPNTPKETP